MEFNPLDPLGIFKRDPEAEKKRALGEMKPLIEDALKDEASAGKVYRETAEMASKAGRPEMARQIQEIAAQEDQHYQRFLLMMIKLEPGYKGMTELRTV